MKISEFKKLAQETSFENALKNVEDIEKGGKSIPVGEIMQIAFILGLLGVIGPEILDTISGLDAEANNVINAFIYK